MTMWSEEQLATYREQGFLVQRGLIPRVRSRRCARARMS